MAMQLPHTLQTWLGMVIDNGTPQQRNYQYSIANIQAQSGSKTILGVDAGKLIDSLPQEPDMSEIESYKPSDILFQAVEHYLRNVETIGTCDSDGGAWESDKIRRLAGNLSACSNGISKEDIKVFIEDKTRFDLEQAAAFVLSAFLKDGRVDDAIRLAKELGKVLASSNMWLDPYVEYPSANQAISMEKIATRLQQSAAAHQWKIPLAKNYRDLVSLLMRTRQAPFAPEARCLHIPNWMFDEADMKPPKPFKDILEEGKEVVVKRADLPMGRVDDNSIIISKRHFRHIQRRIYYLNRFWKPKNEHRERVKKFKEEVLFASSWIKERVFKTEDVALICHYFFYYQRRLQRKVVSDVEWTCFLAKGEGKKLYQNNVQIKSSFENVLLDIAESNEEGVLVAMGHDNTLELIDQVCLLMKEYVDRYGQGNTKNLTFQNGQFGGKGRGPVDEYNLLCDILGQLKGQAREEGIQDLPGLVKRFLAKDIMSWNKSWKADAFAGNQRPGWEDWIKKRGLLDGVVGDAEDDWALVDAEKDEISLPLR